MSKLDDRNIIIRRSRKQIEELMNVMILGCVIAGVYLMLSNPDAGVVLTSTGVENLKFFTVLSNIFCGIVAAAALVMSFCGKRMPVLPKLMAAAAVSLTFMIVAAVLAPLYPDYDMYAGSNRMFHLIVPLVAMVDFVFLNVDGKIPFKYTLISAVLSLVYGNFYLGNILINGIGVWPESNDWYGFLNWGWPMGIAIFAFVIFMNWLLACALLFLNSLVNKLLRKMSKQA